MSDDGSSASTMLERLEAESGRPLRAMLEISDRCNEVCVHCYQVQGRKGELSTGEWKTALDQLAEQGVLLLTISGGEATLRSDFLELLGHARERGFIVRLFTNGLTMTDALAAELRRLSLLDVEISLYSTRPEMHDFVTGVKGSFERTVAGVRALRRVGVTVTLKTVVMSVNQDELDAYVALAAELDAQFRLDAAGIMPREGGDRSPEALRAADAALIAVQRRYALPDEQASETHAQLRGGRQAADEILCGAAHSLHVEPNGEVRPCTMLDVKLGHVLQDGPLASFHSPVAKDMRALRWGDVHGCRECDLSRYCVRCFAAALTETGDALGPYPSACEGARRGYNASHPETDLKIIAAPGRDAALGPYRARAPGVFETSDDTVIQRDRELHERLGWTRNASGGIESPALAVRPGELIQIRRPGRKSSRLERVPGGQHAERTERDTGARSTALSADTGLSSKPTPHDTAR